MFVLSFILLLPLFLGTVTAFTCPPGAIPTRTNKAECYYFGTEMSYFLEAEDACDAMPMGGHLVSIHNMMDNMFIAQEALKRFDHNPTGDFWIGMSNIVQTTWSWIDSTPFDFFNWKDESQPNRTDAACGSVLLESGTWISDYCMIKKPFVCYVPALNDEDVVPATDIPTPPPPPPPTVASKDCPPSWSFYETTGFCYKVFEDADWNGAEKGCRQNDAHLASIHSLEEAMFVGILAYIPGAEQCDGSKQAWIGLYSNDNNLSWQWTDGTPFDYNKWGNTQPDFPESQHCVQLFSSSNQCNWLLGDFDNYDCNSKLSSYICKKAPA